MDYFVMWYRYIDIYKSATGGVAGLFSAPCRLVF